MPVDITVVENPDPKNDNTFDSQAYEYYELIGADPKKAESLKDLVDEILAAAGDDCIRTLQIVAHGSPGQISAGSGTTSIAGMSMGNPRSPWQEQLRRLQGRFCEDSGFVTLNGCNVGADDAGSQFLQEVLSFFGSGFSTTVISTGMFMDSFSKQTLALMGA